MGHGGYSVINSRTREATVYKKSTRTEVFKQYKLNEEMNPKNVIRECRDSDDHPNTIPVIIFLDETGSMGHIPHEFIKGKMTDLMEFLFNKGLKDIQILFGGIGDHVCDNAPLQVGQFEANDQLLDKWLKNIYLEGKGGANDGESYLLAWKFAADHTEIDSFEKRGQKGFLFTIGDEPTLSSISVDAQKELFGEGQSSLKADKLLTEAMKKYHVFHLHMTCTGSGARKSVQDGWKQMLHENAIMVDSVDDIPKIMVELIQSEVGLCSGNFTSDLEKVEENKESTTMML